MVEDSRPAYRAIETLHFSRLPRPYSAMKAADGTTITEHSEIRARLPGHATNVQNGTPTLVSCHQSNLDGTRTAVDQLKCRKALGGCGIYAGMLKARCAAAFLLLHTPLFQKHTALGT